MPDRPQISNAEWTVMRAIWSGGPQTSAEVIRRLEGRTDWSPRTIRTLLGRLARKGAVRAEPSGREYVYHPALDETECARDEASSLVDRVFGGALAPMIACLIDDRPITPEEAAELRRLLDAADRATTEPGGDA